MDKTTLEKFVDIGKELKADSLFALRRLATTKQLPYKQHKQN
jgi:hypothetical protein